MTHCFHPRERQEFVRREPHPVMGFVHVYRCTDCGREADRLILNERTVADMDLERVRRSSYSMYALAVNLGLLVRPAACERCGAKTKVDGHHFDYSRPLDVEWLCRQCHPEADEARREYEKAA